VAERHTQRGARTCARVSGGADAHRAREHGQRGPLARGGVTPGAKKGALPLDSRPQFPQEYGTQRQAGSPIADPIERGAQRASQRRAPMATGLRPIHAGI
jgi:hypothetical protein